MWRFACFVLMAALPKMVMGSGGQQSQKNVLHSNGGRAVRENSQSQKRRFQLLSAKTIRDQLLEWKSAYPDLCRVTTSQEAYGLPRAGGSSDCPFDSGPGCKNYVLTIQDFIAHPEGSDSSNRLPEVFLSGLLHGNERVGPTAVVEAASLLLEAAACEAMPKARNGKGNGGDVDEWETEKSQAASCRSSLRNRGVDDEHRQWLARLVTTRRLVIVPTTNALGYFRDVRTEEGIDPNRDFPYDLTDPTKCMQTIAGRTINEIFREHMFQLSLTFHAGMEVVAYEWGAPSYLHHFSPDDKAQSEIASAYSQYGGGWSGTRNYDVGTMNDLVYYVRGGMEDWAYAGSWDPERVLPCTPTTFDNYDVSKTQYNNSTLRVFNMLVETSDDKTPRKNALGTTLDVLDADTEENGHVSRNIRLALLAADIVEPYVSVLGVDGLLLTDDIVPQSERGDRYCRNMNTIMIPKSSKETTIYWTVGGSLTIDDTSVWYGKWDDLPQGSSVNCLSQPKADAVKSYFHKGDPLSRTDGTGTFSKDGPSPRDESLEIGSLGPIFSARIDTSMFQPMDEIAVIAGARVDQSWRNQPDNVSPEIPPQSHIVNARTDPTWKHESSGKVVEGRLDWYSVPMTIVIGDYTDSLKTDSGEEVGFIELSNRLNDNMDTILHDVKPKGARWDGGLRFGGKHLTGYVVGVTLCSLAVVLLMWYRRKSRRGSFVVDVHERDPLPGVKPYSDTVEEDEDFHTGGNASGDVELAEYA